MASVTDSYFSQWALWEREVSLMCPFGWNYYKDGGTEGKDSCLYIAPNAVANWTDATGYFACPFGSHLLSIGGGNTSGLLPYAQSLSPTAMWIGCSQSSATSTTANWGWVDGTPASNLNTTLLGSAWAAGEPK